jgi:hypothetical protein
MHEPGVEMRRRVAVAALLIAGTALPSVASADVFVEVPTPFLGGPIWKPLLVNSTTDAPGRPSLAPSSSSDSCQFSAPGDCVIVGPGAETDTVPLPAPGPGGIGVPSDGGAPDDTPPEGDTPGVQMSLARAPRPAVPAVPPTDGDLATAFGRLIRPAAADWLPWQRPVLAWKSTTGAAYYNVQIFRGTRRVMNAWSTDTRLKVSEGVLRQGRSYIWVVWPGAGKKGAAKYGPAIGRSSFAITLRPRLVFRTRPGGVVGELRPHVPFASLRLYRPSTSASHSRRLVTLDAGARVRLSISRTAAERLGAVLVDRGPTPPVGLRGPGL